MGIVRQQRRRPRDSTTPAAAWLLSAVIEPDVERRGTVG
jgi:hypothetical protein